MRKFATIYMTIWVVGWPVGLALGTTAMALIYLGLATAAAVHVAIAVARRRPPLPWMLLGAGLVVTVVGDIGSVILFAIDSSYSTRVVLPTNVFHILGMVLLAVGAVAFVVRRSPSTWRAGLLDGVALVALIAGVVWLAIADPIIGANAPLLDRVVPSVFPLFDVVMFGAFTGILFTSRTRSTTLWMVCAFLGSWVFLDLAVAYMKVADVGVVALAVPRSLFLLSYLFLDLAMHRPDVDEVAAPQHETREVSAGRAVLLVLTLALLPVILFVGDQVVGSPFLWVGSVVIVLAGATTAVRFGALVRALHRARAELLMTEAELQSAQSELYRRAMIDALTGLPNRNTMLDRLSTLLDADNETSVVICFLDLNGFKTVNDTYGHHAGDELLQYASQRLVARSREGEVVGRLGGDEFLVVGEVRHAADANALAHRLVDALEEPFAIEGHVVSISASVGVLVVSPGEEPNIALRRADRAMYEAKRRDDTRVVFWHAELEAVS